MRIKTIFTQLTIVLLSLISQVSANVDLLFKMNVNSSPDQLIRCLDEYYEKMSGDHTYQFLITLDKDNPNLNNKIVTNYLDALPFLSYSFVTGLSTIESYNYDIDIFDNFFEILVFVDSNTTPITNHFDKAIVKTMNSQFPANDGVTFIKTSEDVSDTTPAIVVGSKFYQMFQPVFNQVYSEFHWGVRELKEVSKIMGKYYSVDDLFQTECLQNSSDHSATKQTSENQLIFERRLQSNFDIDENTYRKFMNKDWSILICTLTERKEVFSRIYEKLNKQIAENGLQDKIEVLYFLDNRENTVGFKRNTLMRQSRGLYVNYIDDDDDVDDEYIKLIYDAIQKKPDVVSLIGIITFNGRNPRYFIHSIKYVKYFSKNNVYYRPPNHLNTMKRSIAATFDFPDISFGEDTDWAMRICRAKLLQTEVWISKPYYFYYYADK